MIRQSAQRFLLGLEQSSQLVQTQVRHKPFFKLPPGAHWGMKKRDGDRVHRGDLLVNQQGLRFYPGENVRLDNATSSIYALESGTLVISVEKLSPRVDSPIYEAVHEKKATIYKEFLNVVSRKQPQTFRLTEFV